MHGNPLVSIVTPSLNMRDFIEGTVRSVLLQDYPQIEHIVVDGGSSDGTLEVLERYSRHLRYESGPDGGAAAAIRHGFDQSKGDILAYLNADDLYVPGAVSAAVAALEKNPTAAAVYADANWIDRQGRIIARYPTREFDYRALARECFLCQPAVFFRRSAYESIGGIDPHLEFTFDYDLWLRMASRYRFVRLHRLSAKSRMHPTNKTLGRRRAALRETIRTVRRNAGFAGFGHVYAYANHLFDARDQFFEPMRPSIAAFLTAAALGVWWNGPFCRPFWQECRDSVRWLREQRQEVLTVD